MKNYIFTMFMVAVFSSALYAQNESNPWGITVGTNTVDLYQTGIFAKEDLSISPNFSYLEISRYIGSGFSVDLAGTINNIDRISGADDLYYGLDLGTSLTSREVIDLGNFESILRTGLGYVGGLSGISSESEDFFTVYAGAGINYWFNDALALSVKTTYKMYTREFDGLISNDDGGRHHFQHLAGLTFAFGDGDKDRDGVKDSVDECPEVPGLESLNGCPDDDGDGIKDTDDDCPKEAGVAALNGCPDADGDGIKDADDACPNAAGSKAMNGCPDADGDGLADKDDKCPAVAGPASNNGCPEYPLSMLVDYDINFDLEKYNIDATDVQRLSTVIKVLLANSDANISIEGHADNTGEESFNNPLSNNRASSIKDYLVNVGIDAGRLSTKAFGESMPKASNDTEEGRAINRRVEFKVVN